MPDIVTVIDHQGHESIPIVGTLVIDPVLGDYVRAAEDVYYIRPAYILRRREVRPQPEPQPAPEPEPEQVPEPAWEVDPADPYAHLSSQTRRMLEDRDRRQAEEAASAAASAEPPKRKRGRPRKHA